MFLFTSTIFVLLAPEVAALLEPLGVSHNAIERLEVTGEWVLIIGCGPVGLLAIPCAKVMGATRYSWTNIYMIIFPF